MSDWTGKTLGQIADEMKQIDTLEGMINYANKTINSVSEADKRELQGNELSPSDWFWDTVRFIDERSLLPQVWWQN